MLWSLIKILAFVAFVIGATFGATQLMDMEGGALITIAGKEIPLSILQIAIGLVALVLLVWLVCGS